MQNRAKVHKLCRRKKGKKSKKLQKKGSRPPQTGRAADMRSPGSETAVSRVCVRLSGALGHAQRSELVAALVLPVHCQLAISGRSTPCAAMYCRCSTSLSRICCTA